MSKISTSVKRQKTKSTKRTNFEPNGEDINDLLDILQDDLTKFNRMSQEEWLQFKFDNNKSMRKYLYGFMKEHAYLKEIKKDQQKRARAIARAIYSRFFQRKTDIADEFQQEQKRENNAFERTRSFEMDSAAGLPSISSRQSSGPSRLDYQRLSRFSANHLVTMDGHGRMIWSILDAFHKLWPPGSVVPELRIRVMDIDKDTSLFHKMIFPRNVSLGQDIIRFAETLLRHRQIYSKDDTMPLIYFNFTSLGNQAKSFFDCLTKFALRNQQCFFSYMLRFSSRGQNPNVALSEFQNVTEKLKNEGYFIDISGDNIVQYQTNTVSLRTHFITHELLGNTDVYSLSGFANGLGTILIEIKSNAMKSETYLMDKFPGTFREVLLQIKRDGNIPLQKPDELDILFEYRCRLYKTKLKGALKVIFSRQIISRQAMRNDWLTYRTTNYMRLLYNLFYYESILQASPQIAELAINFRSCLPKDAPTAESMKQYNRLLLVFLSNIDNTIQKIYEAQRIDDQLRVQSPEANQSSSAAGSSNKRPRSNNTLLF